MGRSLAVGRSTEDVVSGRVSISVADTEAEQHRIAVLGPGSHCGDLQLTAGETRVESALALTPCVLRSLSRAAVSAGVGGLLDRTPTERRIVASILRSGPTSVAELQERLPDVDPARLATAIALLRADTALVDRDGPFTVALGHGRRSGSGGVLDRLDDL